MDLGYHAEFQFRLYIRNLSVHYSWLLELHTKDPVVLEINIWARSKRLNRLHRPFLLVGGSKDGSR